MCGLRGSAAPRESVSELSPQPIWCRMRRFLERIAATQLVSRDDVRNLLTMITLAASTVCVGAAQAQTTSAQGDATKGRGLYSGAPGGGLCMLCHGPQGQGGFGP